MKKKKKPEIRFRGFIEDWEQRKLGEYCEMFNGDRSSKYPGAQDMVSVGIPFINAGDLEDGHVNLTTANKITREKYDDLGGAKLQLGDIVYCLRGTLGKNAYIDNFTEGTVASSLVAIRPKNIDGRYLFHILNSDIEYRQRVVHDEGAAQPNLSAKSVSEFIIPIPDIDEQEKISSYLDNLSTLITLHQRKLEKLQNFKKSMLEKMFPQNDSKTPQIRFKGFTNDWEQRKLEEYLKVSNEKNTSNVYDKQDVLSVSGDYGIVNQIEFQGRSFAGASVSNYGVVHTGDIVYTKSPLNSNPYGIIKTNKGNTGIVSTLYAIYHPRENTYADFVQTYFEQHARMNNYIHPLVNKGAKNDMKVSAENALKGHIIFPKYEEQKVISNFFTVIDHLITLHHR